MRFTVALCVLGLLLSTGCGGLVLSDHPLSGDADSVVDKRLIGYWEQVPDEDEPEKPRGRFLVGYAPGSDRLLEVVGMELDKQQRVEIKRYRLHTLEIEGAWYLSVGGKDAKAFILARYDIDAKGKLSFQVLSEEGVAAAIRKQQVDGRVQENPGAKDGDKKAPRFKEVRLTASTAKLRAWLGRAGKTIWERREAVAQRIHPPLPARGEASGGK